MHAVSEGSAPSAPRLIGEIGWVCGVTVVDDVVEGINSIVHGHGSGRVVGVRPDLYPYCRSCGQLAVRDSISMGRY